MCSDSEMKNLKLASNLLAENVIRYHNNKIPIDSSIVSKYVSSEELYVPFISSKYPLPVDIIFFIFKHLNITSFMSVIRVSKALNFYGMKFNDLNILQLQFVSPYFVFKAPWLNVLMAKI